MDIRDHGLWHRYTPGRLPKNAPPNTLFARREGDGTDWYDYVHSGENFDADTVKMTIVNGTVGAAVHDPTLLFPGNATVLEIRGAPSGDPQEAFGRKVYNPARKTFSDPPPPQDFPNPMADLLKRIEALEGKKS
jgi:hypothetical protein